MGLDAYLPLIISGKSWRKAADNGRLGVVRGKKDWTLIPGTFTRGIGSNQ
jgi:hypothetical protein